MIASVKTEEVTVVREGEKEEKRDILSVIRNW